MRVLLFTGKGGVGKSTVAAATALRTAEAGLRTLVCSTDPAHSLADAFDEASLGDVPARIATLGRGTLLGQQLDARARLEESWGEVREYLTALFDWAGAGAIEAEELAVIPGLDEVFALAEIRAHAEAGDYDVIVVDCAPTSETLRLLSLPDVLTWYMERVFPAQRHVTRAVRPLLSRLVSPPIAGDDVFSAVRRFYDRLDGVRELLTDGVRPRPRADGRPRRSRARRRGPPVRLRPPAGRHGRRRWPAVAGRAVPGRRRRRRARAVDATAVHRPHRRRARTPER